MAPTRSRAARATPPLAVREAWRRLRLRLWAILQTAAAAVGAWYASVLLLPDPEPAFAAIAATIALGVTIGQRGQRAIELIGGVVVGITVADVIVRLIGTGAWQMGVMVVLAMSAAVLLGGGALLIGEAAVSAVLLTTMDPVEGAALVPLRPLEALIGGAVALAVNSLFFPPEPALLVGRAVQGLFAELGRTLELAGTALAGRDIGAAELAIAAAGAADAHVGEVDEALATGREIARLAPPRRAARVQVDRYERTVAQLDFAVRDTRVLTRRVLRLVRAGADVPADLHEAIGELARAVWELAGAYDHPDRVFEVMRLAHAAAARATAVADGNRDLALSELVGQVRSIAVDLMRAAELVTGMPGGPGELATEELLAPGAGATRDPAGGR